jgi:hypothetical protein
VLCLVAPPSLGRTLCPHPLLRRYCRIFVASPTYKIDCCAVIPPLPLKPQPARLIMVHHCAGKKVTRHAHGHCHPSPLILIVVLTLQPYHSPPCHGPLLHRSNQSDLWNRPIGPEKRVVRSVSVSVGWRCVPLAVSTCQPHRPHWRIFS